MLVAKPLSYPLIFTVKELIIALLGTSLKLKPLIYKYLLEVDAYVFVIVAYVVLSVLVYIFAALDTDK